MHKAMNLFKSLPFVLVTMIGAFLIFKPYISAFVKGCLYSLSLSIKDILVFLIPFIIFASIFPILVELGKSRFRCVIRFIFITCLSNFLSTFIAYAVGKLLFYEGTCQVTNLLSPMNKLQPLWSLNLYPIISTDNSLLFSILCGVICSFRSDTVYAEKIGEILKKSVCFLIRNIFIPILPLFILGFIVKLDADGILRDILHSKKTTLITIFLTQFLYITFISSSATIPLPIEANGKNLPHHPLAKALNIGATNIYLISDSIGVPFMVISLFLSVHNILPSFLTFLIFSLNFIVTKFCMVAIPGSGIIVMIPILEQYMGFSSEMSALISALYVLFDPNNSTTKVSESRPFTKVFTKYFYSSNVPSLSLKEP